MPVGASKGNAWAALRVWGPSVLGFVLSIVVGALLLFSSASAEQRACLVCHGGAVAQAAESGPHADVPCVQCHRDSDVFGVLDFRARMGRMLVRAPLGASGPAKAIPVDRCMHCHEQLLDETVATADFRMSHREPVEARMACTDCHSESMHPGIRMTGGRVEMAECLRCHAVSAKTMDCDLCHVQSVARARRVSTGSFGKTHGPDWQRMHGMGDLNTCAACHSATRCQSCHGTAIPHEPQWLNMHGTRAMAEDTSCLRCHTSAFCDRCHQFPMPHPDDFRQQHQTAARTMEDARCVKCHGVETCHGCHAKHTHPGLAPDRVKKLRDEAGLDG